MPEDNIAIQLRSLAVENRGRAEFFELAADLHEQGYQSDVEAAKAALAPQIAQLESDKRSLTEAVAARDIELSVAQARIAELEGQLGITASTPTE